MNLADLRRTLGVDGDGLGCSSGSGQEADDDGLCGGADSKARQRRLSMERMDILKVCFVKLCLQFFIFFLFAYLFISSASCTILFLLHGFAIFSFSYLFLVGLLWLIIFIFQLTPDVRQLHARTGHRRLHEVETMWPKAPASHLERPPQFVSVIAIFFFVTFRRS